MSKPNWIDHFPAAITVCDKDGIIISMNEKAVATFASDGGTALIGTNLLDCHPEPSKTRLREMLEAGRGNCYTIEKKGVHKLIYQSPWYESGQFAGLVEISMEIPYPMPHFVRS